LFFIFLICHTEKRYKGTTDHQKYQQLQAATDEAKANMLRSKATFDEVTQTLNHTKAALKESLTLDEQKNASE
jgi:hypothetical protein